MNFLIDKLNVSIGGNHILHDVTLDIEEGEFFSLLGNSGCGKSTLLKTIAGLIQEQSGSIMLGDLPLHCLPPQKRNTAIVFQDMRLFPNMTVGENVAYALRLKKIKKAERVKRVDELLEFVHLEGFAKRRINQLSGGQSQRVAIARALAAEPRLLLLDEPFSALDENLRESMRAFVLEVHCNTGLTTIMVTHNQHEALAMSDHVAVMDAGRIIQIGTPEEVYDQPANQKIALYLSDGDTFDGVVASGKFMFGGYTLNCSQADGPCRAIVRACAVSVATNGDPFVVETLEYCGQFYRASIRHDQFVLHYSFGAHSGVTVGDTINISLDASKVLFFPLADSRLEA